MKRNLIVEGSKFNLLTAIKKTDKKVSGRPVWIWLCDCGTSIEWRSDTVRGGSKKSCGCILDDQFKNVIGKVFSRLTVVERSSKTGLDGSKYVKCKCSCGEEIETLINSLKKGNTKSCGCLQREKAKDMMSTHGKSQRSLF